MSLEVAIMDFCARVYEATCEVPSVIELPPASFDALRFARRGGEVLMETGHGVAVLRRGEEKPQR